MSWFKGTIEGNTSMSNPISEPRGSRPTAEARLWEMDQRGAPPPTAPTRAETKVEPKPEAKSASEARVLPAQKPVASVFGATLRFKGELRAEEDFVLQGRIEGAIHHTQNLTIGTDGVVKGDSRARTIVVEGTVDGDLYALESISLRPTAKVQGNLLAPRVAIADGASFNGKVDMASATRAVRTIADRHSTTLDERATEQLLVTGRLAP